MGSHSKIEWTDATWNPLRGCIKVSPGCKHCYAEIFAERFRGVTGHPYEYGFDLRLVPEKLLEPLRWTMPRMVCVNSMSDLFQDGVPDEYIITVARVMVMAHWHTFQVLTKRAERMRDMLSDSLNFAAHARHIWWGVSVEDRRYGIPRIAQLRAVPVQVRFLSIEPLLEDLGQIDLTGIHWVIVGGESGTGAHPMQQAWGESIHDQCVAVQIPFFFKQWGGFPMAWRSSANGMPFAAWRICKVGRQERDIAARKDESMLTTGLAEILTLIEKLSPEEKRQLMEYVARDLQRTPSAPVRLSWQDARGLGKDIWAGVEVDQYIDALRQEWDR